MSIDALTEGLKGLIESFDNPTKITTNSPKEQENVAPLDGMADPKPVAPKMEASINAGRFADKVSAIVPDIEINSTDAQPMDIMTLVATVQARGSELVEGAEEMVNKARTAANVVTNAGDEAADFVDQAANLGNLLTELAKKL